MGISGKDDHPDRPGFVGRFDTGAPLAGGYSGLSGLAPDEDTGARGRLETAYLVADGGYGELRLGKDRGVAARFHEGGPTSLKEMVGENHDYRGEWGTTAA